MGVSQVENGHKKLANCQFFLGAPNIDSNRPILNGFMLGIAHNWVQPHMG